MASLWNSTKYTKKNLHLFFSNYCKIWKRRKHSQTLSMKPPLPWYQNQKKTLQKKAIIGQYIWWIRGASRWWRSKTWRSPSSPQIHQKYIYMWTNSYRTPTERWQKNSDLPKGKKLPTHLGRKEKRKKQRQKTRDGTCTSGRELWGRKGFHTLGRRFAGGDCGWQRWKLRSHGGECSNRDAEGKAERFPHGGSVPNSTHQPERLVWWPAGTGGGWELRLRLLDQIPGRGLGLAVWTQPEGG